MRLPIIRHTLEYIEQHDETSLTKAIEVLEHVAEARGIKDEELDVIGELLSNLYGTLEVSNAMKNGQPKKDALNEFMQRVMGSID